MLNRHGRPDNPGDRPDHAPSPVRWPGGRYTIEPPDPDGWEPPADDDDRWVLADPDDAESGPTVDDGFTPDPLDDAEWLGMSLRLDGEPMGELAGTNSTALLLRFAIGQMFGLEARIDRRPAGDDGRPRETDGYAPGYSS